MSKNKNISIDKRLSINIKELGFILGDILIEQEGVKLYTTVEKLRYLTKDLREENKHGNIIKIKKIISRLKSDDTHKIIKAFSIYFIW